MSGALIELTPLSRVLLWLRGVVLFLQLWRVVLGRPALALSFILQFGGTFPLFQIRRPKVSLLLFKLLLDLDGYQYVVPSEEMFRNSISCLENLRQNHIINLVSTRFEPTSVVLGCTCVGSHGILEPNVALYP